MANHQEYYGELSRIYNYINELKNLTSHYKKIRILKLKLSKTIFGRRKKNDRKLKDKKRSYEERQLFITTNNSSLE